jgi:hypothetical protein
MSANGVAFLLGQPHLSHTGINIPLVLQIHEVLELVNIQIKNNFIIRFMSPGKHLFSVMLRVSCTGETPYEFQILNLSKNRVEAVRVLDSMNTPQQHTIQLVLNVNEPEDEFCLRVQAKSNPMILMPPVFSCMICPLVAGSVEGTPNSIPKFTSKTSIGDSDFKNVNCSMLAPTTEDKQPSYSYDESKSSGHRFDKGVVQTIVDGNVSFGVGSDFIELLGIKMRYSKEHHELQLSFDGGNVWRKIVTRNLE